MLRLILQEFAFFTLPFLAFAAYLLLSRRSPLESAHWTPHRVWLVLAGLSVVIASLVAMGLTARRYPDGYVPPHLENGRVVPGHFE